MSKQPVKTFVIIDSNAVIHRSYHALPPLTSPQGTLVNAVYGYSSLLLKVLRELKPDYIAAAFDLAGPTFRHEAFKDYKATRVKAPDELYAQIPLVKKILEAFSIPIFENQGFEADDVIGTLVEKLRGTADVNSFIVTGDMDTLQLVSENAKVYTLKSGLKEAFIYGEKEVRDRYGLSPVQMPDFKGLKGDPSDNIPGVPGIGDKTASALLAKFGTLEAIYESLEKEKSACPENASAESGTKKRKAKAPMSVFKKPLTTKLAALLEEYRDQAFFSRELATINRSVPLDFSLEKTARREYRRDNVVALFREFGFLSLVERLEWADLAGSGASENTEQKKTSERNRPGKAELLDAEFVKRALAGKSELYIHLQTEELLGTVVPKFMLLATENEARMSDFSSLSKNKALFAAVKDALEDDSMPKCCHGAKTLGRFLKKQGIDLQGTLFDTEIACALVHSSGRDTSFKTAVLQELGEEMRPLPDEQQALILWEYLVRLKKSFAEKIKRFGLEKVFYEMEMPLIPVLAAMEERGIKIDTTRIENLRGKFEANLEQCEKEIYALAGTVFNINSVKELREVLFEKMKIVVQGLRKTAGGVISTQASELEKLRQSHPIVEKILAYRELFKIKTTYLDTLPGLADGQGRVHTTYMQLGASTGRLSSQEPNLQNIPIRGEWGTEMRSMFVAEKGWRLLAADYSQLELRIAAHLAKDPVMQEAFIQSKDIHTRTASVVFGVPEDKVTKDMRMQAKTLNFGVLYGMGPQAFSETAGTDFDTAKKFISDYFREFAALKGYIDAVKGEAEARGYVETMFGRRRYIPEIRSQNFAVRRAGERMAVNMPIQGTEADIIKSAMVRIAGIIEKESWQNDVRMLLQVHDELVFEVSDAILEASAKAIKTAMENVVRLDVPLVTECKAGPSWGEMKPVEF
jgi:DNA polymerase I